MSRSSYGCVISAGKNRAFEWGREKER